MAAAAVTVLLLYMGACQALPMLYALCHEDSQDMACSI
jgi:hypothetical protein